MSVKPSEKSQSAGITQEVLNVAYTSLWRYDETIEIESIRSFDPDQTTQYGLTSAQYEALTLACERGYFMVPREVDLETVADELGVSHQALSERLRRDHQTLINTVLGGPGTLMSWDS